MKTKKQWSPERNINWPNGNEKIKKKFMIFGPGNAITLKQYIAELMNNRLIKSVEEVRTYTNSMHMDNIHSKET